MSQKFSTGDVVRLKSGGPDMTVKNWSDHREGFRCQWFKGGSLESGYFPPDSLERVSEDDEGKAE